VYAVLGIIKVKSEHLEEFVQHAASHASTSTLEPGCLRFEVLQDRDDPQTICLFEVFRSEADLAVHRQQEYYRRWMDMSKNWRDSSSYSRRVLRPIYPPDPHA
jgi:autoinducer 2-degrading protein